MAESIATATSHNIEEMDESHSIDKFTFDDYYLDAYIATGNKAESFEKACLATGYPVPKYLKQSAYSFHKRMERDGYIEKALLDATLMDRINARLKLNYLRDHAESEQVQFAAAKHTSGSLYSNESQASGIEITINRDNVQISHKNQTLTIEDK